MEVAKEGQKGIGDLKSSVFSMLSSFASRMERDSFMLENARSHRIGSGVGAYWKKKRTYKSDAYYKRDGSRTKGYNEIHGNGRRMT